MDDIEGIGATMHRQIQRDRELDAARQSGVREGMERAAKLVCPECAKGEWRRFGASTINDVGAVYHHYFAKVCPAGPIWAALAEEGRPK